MNNITYRRLERIIFTACLAAAEDLGPKLKDLSWFGRNAHHVTQRSLPEAKE